MISENKLVKHLSENFEDTNSEKDRFIKDMLILIEFGQFEPNDDELEMQPEEFL